MMYRSHVAFNNYSFIDHFSHDMRFAVGACSSHRTSDLSWYVIRNAWHQLWAALRPYYALRFTYDSRRSCWKQTLKFRSHSLALSRLEPHHQTQQFWSFSVTQISEFEFKFDQRISWIHYVDHFKDGKFDGIPNLASKIRFVLWLWIDGITKNVPSYLFFEIVLNS